MSPDSIALNPLEEAQQTAFFFWCAMNFAHCPQLRWTFAIPNGGERNKIVAAKLKAQGVKAGVPDVMLPVAHYCGERFYCGLWLELKKVKGGNVSDAQREWQQYLSNAGYAHRICAGYAAMRDAVKQYMGLERPWKDTLD